MVDVTFAGNAATIALVNGTATIGTVMIEEWWAHLAYLDAEQVARVWTDEREALLDLQYPADSRRRQRTRGGNSISPVKRSTVVSYLKESKPMVGEKPGRYADFPVPAPVPGRTLIWVPAPGRTIDDLVQDLRRWWRERPQQTRGEHGEFYIKYDLYGVTDDTAGQGGQ